jgi:protein-tyrosine phosphatase
LIDLHSHVLPGLDDGSATVAEAAEMCRAAQADGITVLAATPHVREDYPTTPYAMEAALERVREIARGIVTVVPGGELDLAELARPPAELSRFALAGNPGYLLVETPYRGWPLDIGQRLARLRAQGMTAVLAHPERNDEVQRRPDLLEPLVAFGALAQLTAASVDGRLGKRAQDCAFELLERRLAHLIASDAHHPSIRAIGMSDAAAAVGDEALARWLTEDVPRSIVERTTTPPRPEQVRPRRRRWFVFR